VDLAGAGQFRRFTGTSRDALDAGSAAYGSGAQTCATLVCHNLVTTPTGTGNWEGAGAPACSTTCHAVEYSATGREGHQQHAVAKGYGCGQCHVDHTGDFKHLTGVVQFAWNNSGTLEWTYGSASAGAYSKGNFTYSYSGASANGTCANVYCHVDKTTLVWNTTTAACTLCHTRSTGGYNPSSGLHYGATAPTVSGKWHDDTLDTAKGCTVCHTALSGLATHVNGTFKDNSGATTAMSLIADYHQVTAGVGTCWGTVVVSGTACHGGVGEKGVWQREWNSAVHYASGDTPCSGCHGGLANDWSFGTGAHSTTDGSVEHGYNLWDTNSAAAQVIG
jgi:predicted CxxxxCH...CXXCH cytochrome family protein